MPHEVEAQEQHAHGPSDEGFSRIPGISPDTLSLVGLEQAIARLLAVHRSLRKGSPAHEADDGAGTAAAAAASGFCFGRYQVFPQARLVLRDGQPVEIGNRAFDILVALLRSPGTIVSKDEIVKSVWPTTHVVEGNLRFQMSELRKALSDDRDVIKTIPGRGYILLVK
ncbi:winged helix-turn-helix domain-containing protein [Ferrovibrio xuzhouensis]|uniref:Transcriptional regulator n=1 Tax=Ferrovibrio xuzhouensis TaxID=1576914 RepID=A0ABV7VJR0_9PROT